MDICIILAGGGPVVLNFSKFLNFSESSAVEIDNLYLQLSQPGRNWNQAELAALKRRQAKLYRREIRETRLNHLKRNTQRYTEVSSFGGTTHKL